jgi:hypothetical protein
LRRRTVAIGAAIGALAVAAGGAGIARAVGEGSDEPVTGPAAAKASSAALEATGGGTVLGIERQDGDGPGVFEVEVRRADGSQVDLQLDARFRPVGTTADDDNSGSDDRPDEADGS